MRVADTAVKNKHLWFAFRLLTCFTRGLTRNFTLKIKINAFAHLLSAFALYVVFYLDDNISYSTQLFTDGK